MRIKSSTIKIFSIFLFLALFLQIPIYHGYSLNKDKNGELEIAEEEVKEPVQGGSEAVVNTKQTIKIKKVDPDGKPLVGVKFTLNGDTYTTDSRGEVEIPVWKYPEGSMKLVEPEQTINGVTYTKKEIPVNRNVNICKSTLPTMKNCYDGVCFWGEVEGNKLMTYENLISQLGITEGYKPRIPRNGYEEIYDKNAEEESKGSIWLKFTDSKYTRDGKPRTYYVMKKPVRHSVSWNTLHTAGAVYGWDVIDQNTGLPKSSPEKYKNIGKNGTNKDYKAKIVTINGQKYIVRLLQGKTNYGGDVTNDKSYLSGNDDHNSEWNRTILPITQGYRFGKDSFGDNILDAIYAEQELIDSDENPDYSLRRYKVQTANYNWFGDLTLGSYDDWNYNGKKYNKTGSFGHNNLVQELAIEGSFRSSRGSADTDVGASYSFATYSDSTSFDLGVRLVLEPYNPQPIPEPKNCYDGVCFQCEVDGSSLISYENLIKELGITQGSKPSIPRSGYEEIYDKNAEEESKGGIWLKFTDSKYTRDGKPRTYYVMKKPARMGVSWNTLHTAGVVYGWDVIDPNTGLPKSSPEKYKNIGKYGNNADYKGKIITINGEKYIVRLLQGKTNYGGDVTNTKLWSYNGANANSEWNRTMLPITQGYRFGSSTNSGSYAEQALRDSDGNSDYSLRSYKVQTANYNWFGDLTLGAYEDWNYNGKKYTGRKGSYVGQWNWVQEFGEADYYRSYRGGDNVSYGAAHSNSYYSSNTDAGRGVRLVLEPLTTSY